MVSWILCLLLTAAIPGQNECTAVFFSSPRCEPCQQVTPALQKLLQEGWDVRMVNAPENRELASQYRIDTLPTVVIVGTNTRREIDRVVGVVSHEQLEARLLRAAARFSDVPLADSRTASGPTVRGQSPVGGFPMLASSLAGAAPVGAALADRLSTGAGNVPPQVASRVREELASSTPFPQPTQSPRQLTVEQAIARAAAATVRIKIEEAESIAYGTGTIIDVHGNEALVLTCGHMFRELANESAPLDSRISVDLFAGTPRETSAPAKLIDFRAEDEDIGLISFVLPIPIEPVPVLPRGEQLSVGQAAFSFGCDHGQPPSRRDTQILHINRFQGPANVEIAGAPAVGRSGGGLFDVQGRLIGVCNGAEPESDQGVYAAADVMYSQIARLELNHLFEPKLAPAGGAAIQLASGGPAPPPLNASFATTSNDLTGGFASDSEGIQWPDQKLNPQPLGGASSPNPGEVICIVRSASGESKMVTIAKPTPELLRAIEQHASR
jgi:hypothetical protein